MSFGLCNAPATFQRLMNMVVAGLEGVAVYLDDVAVYLDDVVVYLDDVVVFSDTWDDHIQHIGALFCRLAEAHLTVNLAKCEFARATVTGGRTAASSSGRREGAGHFAVSCAHY